MSAHRPTFRVMKNGYDRFAVDDAIENYAARVEELEEKVRTYEQQLQVVAEQLRTVQEQYMSLEKSITAEKQAAESIARLSLREANEIIDTAQKNADLIVRQSLLTAAEVMSELSKLYGDAAIVKEETRENFARMVRQLDTVQLPQMPDMNWLKNAEEKMR